MVQGTTWFLTLPSGHQMVDGGISYDEELDEGAQLVLDSDSNDD